MYSFSVVNKSNNYWHSHYVATMYSFSVVNKSNNYWHSHYVATMLSMCRALPLLEGNPTEPILMHYGYSLRFKF